jgi:DNA-binding NarL/FixJ family response regulator
MWVAERIRVRRWRVAEDQGCVVIASMDSNSKIRILLADDHKMLRDGVRGLLAYEPDFEVIGEARDGEEAVVLTHETHPDVVLMDINMPKLNGMEATRRIKREDPDVAVIALTMHGNDQMRQAMTRAGSDAYVRKDEPPEILFETIRQKCAPRHA